MKYILIFLYVAISVLFLFLNWELFTTFLVFDMGFAEFKTLPFVVLQVFGGVVLGVFALVDVYKDLKREVKINELQNTILTMQKDAEIASLRKEKIIVKPESAVIKETAPTSK